MAITKPSPSRRSFSCSSGSGERRTALDTCSMSSFQEAGLPRLIEKSRRLTGFLEWLVKRCCGERIGIITPLTERGCQLSLLIRDPGVDARRLFDRLAELNVIGDWREPDVIRLAPAPLYNSFGDVFECAGRLQQALDDA